MNDLTVIQATQGLVAYLESDAGDSAELLRERGVAIGFDHRALPALGISSARFAVLAAQVCLSRGIKVKLVACGGAARDSAFPFSCTPMVPFAVKTHGCAAGVMVTASHNPKEDDGYKVYWGNGCQIIPPHDKGIAMNIEENQTPWDAAAYAGCTMESVLSSALVQDVTADLSRQYFAEVARGLCYHRGAEEGEDDDEGRSTFAPTYTVSCPDSYFCRIVCLFSYSNSSTCASSAMPLFAAIADRIASAAVKRFRYCTFFAASLNLCSV